MFASVLDGWKSILRNHVLPVLGDVPLSDVRNRAMRTLVERLAEKELSPPTIKNIMLTVKLTVASVMDSDGNQLCPVNWNSRFIDAPLIDKTKQRKPTFDAEQVSKIVEATFGRMQMAAILLASTGLRAGELLGLECKHFDGRSVRVEQELWRGKIQDPKTTNAKRTIDLHPDVSNLLWHFTGKRRSGFIFQTRSGRFMNQRNLARELYKVEKALGIAQRGFHAFRRFRNTFLRNSLCCPVGLLKFWMGHADQDMSDLYDKVRDDAQFRQDVAKSVGVGFSLPKNLTPRKVKQPKVAEAESPNRPVLELSGVIGHQAEVQPEVSP